MFPAWSDIDTVVIHYTGAVNLPDGDVAETPEQVAPYLRAIQNDSVKRRNYSIGYNAAADWLGRTFELRGWRFKCAANAGHNDRTFAILVLVDGADGATEPQAAGVRAIIAECERRAGRQLKIVGHNQLPGAKTLCCGAGLLADIKAGRFTPRPEVSVEIPPFSDEDDMKSAVMVQINGYPNVFLIGPGSPIHLTPELHAHYTALGVPHLNVAPHAQFVKTLLFQCGLSSTDWG
jgi:hypothetical protein